MSDYLEKIKEIQDRTKAELETKRENKPAAGPCRLCNSHVDPLWIENFGWKVVNACKICEEKEKSNQEHEKLQAEINNLTKRSGLIGLLQDMSFDTHKGQSNAFSISKEYAESFDLNSKQGLYFYGRAGSGKTHLACAIIKHIIQTKLLPVIFVQSIDLLLQLREFDKNKTELEMIERFTKITLLIIDDFGTEKLTDWAQQVFYKIINDRLLTQKPIIFTTNYSLQELENRLGERIASRIASMCKVIKMQDVNHRLERKS